ncbi:MAG: hypothetical protein KA515_00515 [Candidatus Pacebacteria bacterium]|nr:hypothetical protein [Candidatus Paceibacterota bacterium]
MNNPDIFPKNSLDKKESFLSKSKRKILVYLLAGSGIFAATSNPRVTESLALTVPGVHEMYEHGSLSAEEKILATEIKKELGEIIGNFALSMIETGKSVSTSEERTQILQNTPINSPKIEGFESTTISSQYVDDIIKTLPRGNQINIEAVSYGKSLLDKTEEELVGLVYRRSGSVVAMTNPVSRKINFLYLPKYNKPGITQANLFMGFLLHEQGHANDWNANTLLTRQEKMELLLRILKRLDSPDRFISKQVETIGGNDGMKKYLRAIEYFAELNRIYLNTFMQHRLANADILIAKTFNQIMEPGFDQNEAIVIRYKLLGNIDHDPQFLKLATEIETILHPKF